MRESSFEASLTVVVVVVVKEEDHHLILPERLDLLSISLLHIPH